MVAITYHEYLKMFTDTWSKSICLPCSKDDKILCCNHNKQLFIIIIGNSLGGYLFNKEDCEWDKVEVRLNSNKCIENVTSVMVSYNKHIFIKGTIMRI